MGKQDIRSPGQPRSVSEVAAEVQALFDVLVAAAVGEVIAYETLETAINADVRAGAGRTRLAAARRAARIDGMEFDVVPTVGIRRLSDVEVVQTGARSVTSIRRRAHVELLRQATVKPEVLDAKAQKDHKLIVAKMGYISAFATPGEITPGTVAKVLIDFDPSGTVQLVLGEGKK